MSWNPRRFMTATGWLVRGDVLAAIAVVAVAVSACSPGTAAAPPMTTETSAVSVHTPRTTLRVPAPKPVVEQDKTMQNLDDLADLFTSYWRQERGIDLDLDAVADIEPGLACTSSTGTSVIWYCEGTNQVGYDYDLMSERSKGLDAVSTARGVLMGHEGGHAALERISRKLADDDYAELRADCLSGAFMRWALARGEVTSDALDTGLGEGYGTLLNLRSDQKEAAEIAFQHGLVRGVDACLGNGAALMYPVQ